VAADELPPVAAASASGAVAVSSAVVVAALDILVERAARADSWTACRKKEKIEKSNPELAVVCFLTAARRCFTGCQQLLRDGNGDCDFSVPAMRRTDVSAEKLDTESFSSCSASPTVSQEVGEGEES
jgi:hypothetical protein